MTSQQLAPPPYQPIVTPAANNSNNPADLLVNRELKKALDDFKEFKQAMVSSDPEFHFSFWFWTFPEFRVSASLTPSLACSVTRCCWCSRRCRKWPGTCSASMTCAFGLWLLPPSCCHCRVWWPSTACWTIVRDGWSRSLRSNWWVSVIPDPCLIFVNIIWFFHPF